MHIVSAADDAYVAHFCAMLHSAWLHNPTASYYLLTPGITAQNADLLGVFARQRNIALEIVEIDAERLVGLPMKPRLTVSTWFRLLIPDMLPTVDRVIYLDADITVVGSLDGLYESDMGGMPVAAAPDGVDSTALIEREMHGLDPANGYFNAGVMLIDLAMWRSRQITDRMVEFARRPGIELLLLDQSVLNAVLQGQIHPVSDEWNFFHFEQILHARDPKVLHYAGPGKPWKSRLSPFHDLYAFHRGHTPWPMETAPVPPRTITIRMLRRRFAAWLGLQRYLSMKQEQERQETATKRLAAASLEQASLLLTQSSHQTGTAIAQAPVRSLAPPSNSPA